MEVKAHFEVRTIDTLKGGDCVVFEHRGSRHVALAVDIAADHPHLGMLNSSADFQEADGLVHWITVQHAKFLCFKNSFVELAEPPLAQATNWLFPRTIIRTSDNYIVALGEEQTMRFFNLRDGQQVHSPGKPLMAFHKWAVRYPLAGDRFETLIEVDAST